MRLAKDNPFRDMDDAALRKFLLSHLLCPHCRKDLQPVAFYEDVYGCKCKKETWFIPFAAIIYAKREGKIEMKTTEQWARIVCYHRLEPEDYPCKLCMDTIDAVRKEEQERCIQQRKKNPKKPIDRAFPGREDTNDPIRY
jgi:hypothetical protein